MRYEDDYLLIHLEPGIHLYEGLSATGKSYLPEFVRKIGVAPIDFLVFDRIDQLDSAEVKIAVEKPNTIIFFDRGDLIFNKDSINEIFKYKDRIVLLDLKNTSIIPPECKTEIKMAVLNREATRMVLTDDSDGRQSEGKYCEL